MSNNYYWVINDDGQSNLVEERRDTLLPEDYNRYTLFVNNNLPDKFVLRQPQNGNNLWKYDNIKGILSDPLGNNVKTTTILDILRITNLFADLNETMTAHFEPGQRVKDKIKNLIFILTEERERNIQAYREQDIKDKNNKITELSKIKHGSSIKIGKQIVKITTYEDNLYWIKALIEKEHSLNGRFKKRITNIINNSNISHYKVFKEINKELNKKYPIPKKQSIRNLIDSLITWNDFSQ